MKIFSTKWKASKKPAKQRKYLYNAPAHTKRKMLKAPLSKDLKKEQNVGAAIVRTGDTVTVMRGDHKGKSGKVVGFSLKDKTKVYVQSIEVTRIDGQKKNVPLHHSNLLITKMADDPRRINKNKSREESAKKKAASKRTVSKQEKPKAQEKKAEAKKTEEKSKTEAEKKTEEKKEAKEDTKAKEKTN